jgi:hypothetical protein
VFFRTPVLVRRRVASPFIASLAIPPPSPSVVAFPLTVDPEIDSRVPAPPTFPMPPPSESAVFPASVVSDTVTVVEET